MPVPPLWREKQPVATKPQPPLQSLPEPGPQTAYGMGLGLLVTERAFSFSQIPEIIPNFDQVLLGGTFLLKAAGVLAAPAVTWHILSRLEKPFSGFLKKSRLRANIALGARIFVTLMTGITAYAMAGWDFTVLAGSSAAIVGAMAGAIVFIARGPAEDIVKAWMLMFSGEYELGDFVECGTARGVIVKLGYFGTEIVEILNPAYSENEPRKTDNQSPDSGAEEIYKQDSYADIIGDDGRLLRLKIHRVPTATLRASGNEVEHLKATKEQLEQIQNARRQYQDRFLEVGQSLDASQNLGHTGELEKTISD